MDDQPQKQDSAEADFLDNLRAASLETAVQHLAAIYRLKHPQGQTAGDMSGPACEPDASRGDDFLFDLANLQLHGYMQWLEFSSKYTDRFVDRLRSLIRPCPAPPSPSHGKCLAIKGALGDEARGNFAVVNQTPLAVRVAFRPLVVRNEEGEQVKVPQPTYEPVYPVPPGKAFQLEPGERRLFRIVLRLKSSNWRAGDYFADLRIVMRGRCVEEVPLKNTSLSRDESLRWIGDDGE